MFDLPPTGYNALEDHQHCNYEERIPFRDPFFTVLFIGHVLVIATTAIMYGGDVYNQVANQAHDPSLINAPINLLASVLIGMIAALLFGLAWIKFLENHAASIVYISVMVNLVVQALMGVIALLAGVPMLSLFAFVSTGILALWYFLFRRRVKFVSILLELSVAAIKNNQLTIWGTFLAQLVTMGWLVLWTTAFLFISQKANASPDNGDQLPQFLLFALFISLFWTVEVLRNSVHTTTAGVCGTFYFFGLARNQTLKAAKRTFTTSFGSVCLGSLIVSIVEAIRLVAQRPGDDNDSEELVTVCLQCLLACVEAIVQYVSKFAFVRVAVYGESFIRAARNTFDLFKSKGIDVIVDDDLSSFALIAGAFLGAAVAAASGVVSSIFLVRDMNLTINVGVASFLFGFAIVALMMSVLTSGVATFIVLWAEEPLALQQNHPELYAKLSDAIHTQFPMFSYPQI